MATTETRETRGGDLGPKTARKLGIGAIALLAVGALVTLGLLGLLLFNLLDDDESAGADAGATVAAIADNPSAFYGRRVTVSGEVDEIVGPRAFTIGGEDFVGGDELLVVNADPSLRIAPPAVSNVPGDGVLDEDDLVQVTGPVRRFDLAEVEREIGADLDDGLFAGWAGKPAVVARQADLTPRAGGPTGVGATVDDITDAPDRYLGRTVTVAGEVDEVLGRRAFTIGGGDFIGDDELLVVGAGELPVIQGRREAATLTADDLVQITGPVRRFNLAEVEREIGVDLEDALFADWRDKPAVIARTIAPMPRVSPAQQSVPVALDAIVADPGEFYGRRVTVSGRVNRVIGPNAFLLNDGVLVAGTAERVPSASLRAGDVVQVTGLLRQFDPAAFERAIGADLEDSLLAAWRGRPAILEPIVKE
ncbi:MAG: hypothetical protein M3Q65_18885, partial [Chloroflexota bacterium]|nr:hypothetical protein [Chloroflexota bacterium]